MTPSEPGRCPSLKAAFTRSVSSSSRRPSSSWAIAVTNSDVFPRCGKWIPFSVVGVAALTYGFHAVARDVWDPPDAVWLVALGVGWVLLGPTIARFTPAEGHEVPSQFPSIASDSGPD